MGFSYGELERRSRVWGVAACRGAEVGFAQVVHEGLPHRRAAAFEDAGVFAVWSESMVFVSSKDTARKSRNLAADGRCVLTTDAGKLHLIVEGEARRVRDHEMLERASQTFEEVYGWPTTVSGEHLDAEYGAPTSGGPPYGIYAITPSKAFALPSEGTFMPTRWRFTPDQ